MEREGTEWNDVPLKQLEENIELMRNGMAVNLPQLYALPSRAGVVHENFVRRLLMYLGTFRLKSFLLSEISERGTILE